MQLCIYIYIYTNDQIRIYLLVILGQNLLSTCEYTPIRSRKRRKASDCFTFLTHHNWEGSDVCHFSLATSSLKLNSNSILTFSGVCFVVLRTWQTFYSRIARRNNSFIRVTWESKYDVGKPETCKDPKNITNEVILNTLWVRDYNYNLGCRFLLFK